MKTVEKVRIDKWLWSVRIFKTRTSAGKACEQGKVKIEGDAVKSSKVLSGGETIDVRVNHRLRTFKVEKLIDKRVGAELAQQCYEDLSPPEPPRQSMKSAFVHFGQRERGSGRPTKKERRDIDRLRDDLDD